MKIQPSTICQLELASEKKQGQHIMEEWSAHKINAIYELSTLAKPCIDYLLNLIYEF